MSLSAAPPEQAPEPSGAPAGRPFPNALVAAAVLATVVLAVAVIVAVRSGSSPTASGPTSTAGLADGLPVGADPTGKPLPSVTYTQFGSGDTETVGQQFAGQPLVINFWSSTCAPCVTEMPAFQKVHEQLGDRVAFLGLDVVDAEDSGQAMLEKTGVRYDVGRDARGDALLALGGSVLPTTVLVAADGTVKLIHAGAFSGDDLSTAITQNLLS